MQGSSPKTETGFTLLETLTVVAVAGILAVLLLAAGPKVFQKAADTACVGNLRTLAGAFGNYTADYNYWPSFNREDSANPAAYGSQPWFFSLIKQGYIPTTREKRDGYDCLVADVLTCPANKANRGRRYQWTSAPYPWEPNYTGNRYWGDNEGQPQVIPGTFDRVRPAEINNGSAILLIDSTASGEAGYPELAADWTKPKCYIAKVHQGGARALLANGSVVTIDPKSHPNIAERRFWDPKFRAQ